MAKNEQEQGIDLWYDTASMLNEIIRESGKIQKDNPKIWTGHLHQESNEDWLLKLAVMYDLYEQHPEFFDEFHTDAMIHAAKILEAAIESGKSRALDRKDSKYAAWKLLMTLREVWNKACGINLPNTDISKRKRSPNEPIIPKPAVELFDYQ
jgi:hypothetical protein